MLYEAHIDILLLMSNVSLSRRSHRRCSVKKSDLKNFTKFIEKHLCQSLFFNKVAGLLCFIEHPGWLSFLWFLRVSSEFFFKPLSANPTKWPNTLKQFVGKLPTNCLSVFGHFVNLALKGLRVFLGLLFERQSWQWNIENDKIL